MKKTTILLWGAVNILFFVFVVLVLLNQGANCCFDNSEQQKNKILVDFSLTANLTVIVPDTNGGEIPDEAWEEAEKILSSLTCLEDIRLKREAWTFIDCQPDI